MPDNAVRGNAMAPRAAPANQRLCVLPECAVVATRQLSQWPGRPARMGGYESQQTRTVGNAPLTNRALVDGEAGMGPCSTEMPPFNTTPTTTATPTPSSPPLLILSEVFNLSPFWDSDKCCPPGLRWHCESSASYRRLFTRHVFPPAFRIRPIYRPPFA
jgi:hypothetical protein